MAKDKIREDALDELEDIYSDMKAARPLTLGELGRIGRIADILRRAKRYPLAMAEG